MTKTESVPKIVSHWLLIHYRQPLQLLRYAKAFARNKVGASGSHSTACSSNVFFTTLVTPSKRTASIAPAVKSTAREKLVI